MGKLKVIQPGERDEAGASDGATGGTEAAGREAGTGEPPRTWRSLEERAGGEELEEKLAREFPRGYFPEGFGGGGHGASFAPLPGSAESPAGDAPADGAGGLDRRRFLQLSGASLALAGMAGCTRQPPEKIVPYVRQPEQIVPGEPLYFATSMTLAGYARPLLAESQMGRPTKIEGNPDHPASRGGSDLFAQASILDLYDPDRAEAITQFGQLRSWTDFVGALEGFMEEHENAGGEGLRILTGAVSSPTTLALLEGLTGRLPNARWHLWEPALGNTYAGARMAFGEPVETVYRVAEADVILALDSDFLTQGPGAVRYARDFAARRDLETREPNLNRLYAVESTPTNTGVTADHRLSLPPQQVAAFALALAAELGVASAPSDLGARLGKPEALRWVREVAADLRAHAGRSLVTVGPEAPAEVHALAHALNESLGNVGTTVTYQEPVVGLPEGQPSPEASIAELVRDMEAGEVSTLLILGGNPVFDAPSDLGFAAALDRVGRRIYLGISHNETSGHCHWMIPESHYLESWGDGRAYDGSVLLAQPLLQPLYDSHTVAEVLAALDGRKDASSYELVREYWTSVGVSDRAFRRGVHDGYLEGRAPAPRTVSAAAADEAASALAVATTPSDEDGLTLVLRLDPTLHDGRFANNSWLQECPKPLTRLTWDNALLISPARAERLGVKNEDVVTLTLPGGAEGAGGEERTLEAPVWVLPGQPDGAATLHLGHGRARVGKIGAGHGVDAYRARTTEHPWAVPGVKVAPAGGRTVALATTQDHFAMEGRHQVRSTSLERYRREPDFAQHMGHAPAEDQTFYEPYEYEGHAWGMAIDLNACTGCNACVIACQSENNIPAVGKQGVLNGREMHWIRIDRYFEGSLDDPEVHHQPVMCQHCELAPCEVVCPVAATVHSSEGLNDMVYNRCVGTRYCSNNCPYKVRRFNFLEYNDHTTPVLKMMRNPDVTVRERGVMEKCTYCVQRINAARQDAKVEGREMRDGDVVTACQQACPSGAIVFGDINDPDAEVTRWKSRPTDYGLLAELNTRPRTSYLAKVKNPNPALEA